MRVRVLQSLEIVALVVMVPLVASASTIQLAANAPETDLRNVAAAAQDGDIIEVCGGTHRGPVLITHRVALVGTGNPVIDGGGAGTVVKLTGAGASIRGITVRNSGSSLDDENAGITVEAANVVVESNTLNDVLFGIYVGKAPECVVRGNIIRGKNIDIARRGDAIRIWYSNGVRIENNDIERCRDLVLWYSEKLLIAGNSIRDGRYALHFMYCDDTLITHNLLTGNSVGAYLMYSRRLHMVSNTVARNRGPSGYGLGLKDMDDAVIESNLFFDNRAGAFVDTSPREIDSRLTCRNNVFALNDGGILIAPSTRRNDYSENSFIDNEEQIVVLGEGKLQGNNWSLDRRGNFWSDYAGFDADHDGIGDVAYRDMHMFESLMDKRPDLRMFLYSPAAQAVDFAARAFPIFDPQPKVTDEFPLMSPPIPQGLPATPESTSRAPLAAASALMFAGGFLATFKTRRARQRGVR